MPPSAPAAAARFVARQGDVGEETDPALSVTTPSVEPGLKPNQPNQRMMGAEGRRRDVVARDRVCPPIGAELAYLVKESAPASAASAPW